MEYTFTRFSGMDYLKIDIANNYGKDKLNWDERLLWFEFNKDNLDSLVPEAEEPALFYAGVQAYKQAVEGNPIGYTVSLDAVCSGMQWLSILTGDRSAAELCCVIGQKRNDAYTAIYQYMVDKLGEGAKIERADTKRAIMTSLYGSERVPTQVFGEGELYDTFISTMEEHAPAAWELNKAFIDMWNPSVSSYHWVMPDNFHVNMNVWGTEEETVHFRNQPYTVTTKVIKPTEKGRSLSPNCIHSLDSMVVREITRRCMYDPKKIEEIKHLLNHGGYTQLEISKSGRLLLELFEHSKESGYLSSRVLDVINKNNIYLLSDEEKNQVWDIINTLPAKPFDVYVIHDAFNCHVNFANDLRWQYIHQMVLISKSNMLSFLLSQILNREVEITKYTEDLHLEIAKSEYAIC